jgi:hypothetical protein
MKRFVCWLLTGHEYGGWFPVDTIHTTLSGTITMHWDANMSISLCVHCSKPEWSPFLVVCCESGAPS